MLTMARIAVATGLIAGLLPSFAAPAMAQTREQLLARFRAQCQAQFAHLRGPGQSEIVSAKIRACITDKMRAAANKKAPAPTASGGTGESLNPLTERFRAECRASVQKQPRRGKKIPDLVSECVVAKITAMMRSGTPTSGPELRLLEFTPWLLSNAGPEKAKGVIYLVRGWSRPGGLDEYLLAPYLMKRLSEQGWDVVAAKVPKALPNQDSAFGIDLGRRATPFVRQRVKELKEQGYKRVVLAGHSWGAWVALLAVQGDAAVAPDALWLSAPNIFGAVKLSNGQPNPFFPLLVSEFAPLLKGVTTPTFLVMPNDPFWDPDPAGRAAVAEKHFSEAKVAHVVLDRPRGFTGHFAAWLPVFDFAYGQCVEAFLDRPRNGTCRTPPLANNDIRSIVNIKQIEEANRKRVTSTAPLLGKRFAVYALDEENEEFDFATAIFRMRAQSQKPETIVFRGDEMCVGKKCSVLLQWSEREFLEFDPATGQLRASWMQI
jgi:pimeloyl-ACP methyl ester carboxylesterase